MKKVIATDLFLVSGDEILLAMKKRKFGEGKWNGVGGKLEPNETIDATAVRETQEEIYVTPTEYEKVGEMLFSDFYNGAQEQLEVHFYRCTKWRGEPTESDEVRPRWFKISEIPYDNMFADDAHWMPLLLAGKKFRGHCDFDENWKITDIEIIEIDGF